MIRLTCITSPLLQNQEPRGSLLLEHTKLLQTNAQQARQHTRLSSANLWQAHSLGHKHAHDATGMLASCALNALTPAANSQLPTTIQHRFSPRGSS
jgi:hypothetical protein